MKKKFTYLGLLLFFIVATAFVVVRYKTKLKNKEVAFYPLIERNGALANSAEWALTKENAAKQIRIIRENPEDTKTALALASTYIQEGRITGNYMYYDGAALKYINDVLKREPENFEALLYKSLIQISQHHFADGLVTAQRAQKANPYNAFVYVLIVDGQVEMGNYAAAIENLDKMVSIRPDIRSYSRISYIREIHGDYPGAIDAMMQAVKAGGYGEEATAWARVQLARLFENTGDLKAAHMHYALALEQRPDYAYALAGLGHIAMCNKEYDKAIINYSKADSLVNDYSFKEQLAEIYKLKGDINKSKMITNEIIKGMNNDAKKADENEDIGHYADRELAHAYLIVNDYNNALKYALNEYNRRPENIDVNETVALVHYKNGNYEKAMPFIETALKTNSKNPSLLCHAGLIYIKAGNVPKGKTLIEDALKLNPNINPELKSESLTALKSL